MRNADWNSGKTPERKGKATIGVDVAMQNVKRSELTHQRQEPLCVTDRFLRVRASQDPAPERANFVIVRGWLLGMDQEVIHEHAPVDMMHHVLEPSLHAATVQPADNVKDMNPLHATCLVCRGCKKRNSQTVATS
jgi:hypothetical protein